MKVLKISILCQALLPLLVMGDSQQGTGSGQHSAVSSSNANSNSQSSSSASSSGYSSEVNVIEFENLGFSGTYNMVSKMSDLYSDDCSCEVGDEAISFSGSNAPLNEEVSVHFRGPLILNSFAYYVSKDFEHGEDSASDWERLAYYEASSSTAENVTFLTKAGKNSTCLGKALTYAGSNGTSKADEATVLAENSLIYSNEEYVIFSNISCDDSGYDKDCGVYRSGIPAYHGYYGKIKMFLFEFKMPEEDTLDKETTNYNMPAIWLLNANIPRTSQYAENVNCSCWGSGCGEFDIFEVLNDTESTHLFSTLHDYQGTGDIQTGIAANGYIKRDYSATNTGGVVFDKNGNAIVFMSNSTSFDSKISAADVNSWIDDAGNSVNYELKSVTAASSSSSSKSKGSGNSLGASDSHLHRILFAIFSIIYWAL